MKLNVEVKSERDARVLAGWKPSPYTDVFLAHSGRVDLGDLFRELPRIFPKLEAFHFHNQREYATPFALPPVESLYLNRVVVGPLDLSRTRRLSIRHARFVDVDAFLAQVAAAPLLEELSLTDATLPSVVPLLNLQRLRLDNVAAPDLLRLAGAAAAKSLAVRVSSDEAFLFLGNSHRFEQLDLDVRTEVRAGLVLDALKPNLVGLAVNRVGGLELADLERVLRVHPNLDVLYLDLFVVPDATWLRRRLAVLLSARNGPVGTFVRRDGDKAIAHRVAAFLFDARVALAWKESRATVSSRRLNF